MSNKVASAENQQGTPLSGDASETTSQTPSTKLEILAYLQGALHDASLNKGKRVRFVQKYRDWLEKLKNFLSRIGYNSRIYKEGKERDLYTLETLCKELNFKFDPVLLKADREKIMYLRGFFDAEGGVPRDSGRFYIQLVQKDYKKMTAIKQLLSDLRIESGKIHNPSRRVDPDYWRLFVSTKHHKLFAEVVGSFHPIKAKILVDRMKI